MDGCGTFFQQNGGVYTGEWKDGQEEGNGKFVSKDGYYRYEGSYKAGMRNGHGTETYTNGKSYTGQWLKDKKHGHGTETTKSGDTFSGQYVNDGKHGEGVYTSAGGKEERRVLWQNNVFVKWLDAAGKEAVENRRDDNDGKGHLQKLLKPKPYKDKLLQEIENLETSNNMETPFDKPEAQAEKESQTKMVQHQKLQNGIIYNGDM